MRAALATLLLTTACTFNADRKLSPGELRGTVVFVTTAQTQVVVAGAHVAIEDSTLSTTTDADGAFIFSGLPAGTYAIDITAAMAGSGPPDTGLRLQNLMLPAISGVTNGLDLGSVAIGAFGDISGTVTNAMGASVIAVLTGIAQAPATSGTFSFTNRLPGTYTLSAIASSESGSSVTPNTTVTVKPRLTTQVPIDFGQAQVAPSGAVSGVARAIGATSQDKISVVMTSGSNQSQTLTTDAEGDYVISPVVAGVYTLTASDVEGLFQPVSVPFVVVAGANVTLPAITLTKPAATPDAGSSLFLVTPGGTDVTLAPAAPVGVAYGDTTAFTVSGTVGYTPSTTVGGTCPEGVWSGSTYTTGSITADCTVEFSATVDTYTVSASGDASLTITPTSQSVTDGDTASFVVTPQPGNTLSMSVTGTCTAGSWSGSTYTTGAITSDCTVAFSASLNTYQVTASGDGHETISPSAAQTVSFGSTATFTVMASASYMLSTTVGGTCPGGSWSGSMYVTGTITSDCTVVLHAAGASYQVTASGDGNETISPNMPSPVSAGSTQTFTVTAISAYALSTSVGGTCLPGSWSGSNYTTGVVNSDCTVTFRATLVGLPFASSFNTGGIILDGEANAGGGLDGSGHAYPASLLTQASAWTSGTVGLANGTNFTLTFPTAGNAPNAVLCIGQLVGLTQGNFTGIALLATDAGLGVPSQIFGFTVIYTDGTSTTVAQGVSDVQTSSGNLGESVAATVANLDDATGSPYGGPAYLYRYLIPLDVTKTIQSLQLPGSPGATAGVSILAMTMTGTPGQYSVTATGDARLTFRSGYEMTVSYGSTAGFQISPDVGYALAGTVGGTCPAGTWDSGGYVTGPITGDCSIIFNSIVGSTMPCGFDASCAATDDDLGCAVACPDELVCGALTQTCVIPAYSTSAGGVVVDEVNGLAWQATTPSSQCPSDPSGSCNNSDAQAYCSSLSIGGYSNVWLLPSITQLFSLTDVGHSPAIDPTAFPFASTGLFWSVTSDASTPGNDWVISGASGIVSSDLGNTSNISTRCVCPIGFAGCGSLTVGGGPSQIGSDGTNLWVANSNDGTVTELVAATGAIVNTYTVGSKPEQVVFDGTNIWVINNQSNDVTEISPATGILGTYPVGVWPWGGVYDGAGSLWVANYKDDTVSRLSVATGAVIGTYPVGSSPWAVVSDGKNMWVANQFSSDVTELDGTTGTVIGTFPAGPQPIAIVFDGANLWVANFNASSVTELSPATGAIIGTYIVGSAPWGFASDGTDLWVANSGSNNVTELDIATGATVGTFAVGPEPIGMYLDGTSLWVANSGTNTISKL